jgi:predicted lipoprotein with Yx(FWY)xxD motif
MMRSTFPFKLAAILAAGTLVLAACGDDDDDDTGATEPAAAATTAPTEATTAATTAEPASTDAPATTVDLGGLYGDDGATETTAGGATATTAAAGGSDDAVVTATSSDLGEMLVGEDGFTVYGFKPDAGGTPSCVDACAGAWPPVLVDSAELPAGLDPAVFSVVEYPDGGFILRAGEWPLYYYSGDSAAGETNGQGVSDVWYVVDPAGQLVEG